jgi:hypothetical protein
METKVWRMTNNTRTSTLQRYRVFDALLVFELQPQVARQDLVHKPVVLERHEGERAHSAMSFVLLVVR